MEITFWGDELIKPDIEADCSKAEACIRMPSPMDKEYEQRLCREMHGKSSFLDAQSKNEKIQRPWEII